jgi:hypothetical protein
MAIATIARKEGEGEKEKDLFFSSFPAVSGGEPIHKK